MNTVLTISVSQVMWVILEEDNTMSPSILHIHSSVIGVVGARAASGDSVKVSLPGFHSGDVGLDF